MGLNHSLCPDNQLKPAYHWCFYEAVDDYSIIVENTYLLVLIVLALIIGKYFITLLAYRRDRKYRKIFSREYLYIYYIIFGWLFCSLTKTILNIIIYEQYMYQDFKGQQQISFPVVHSEDRSSDQPIVIISIIFQFFDTLCAFFVLFVIILIPYQWLNNVLQSIDENLIQFQVRRIIQICFKILKGVRFYKNFVRALFFLFFVIEPLLVFFTSISCSVFKVNSYYVFIQSLLILCFYLFGYVVSLLMKKYSLIKLEEKDQQRIKKQYILLLFATTVRIILSIIFKITTIVSYTPNRNCSETDTSHKLATTIFLLLAKTIMHIMPILVVVYIYRPDIQQKRTPFYYQKKSLNDTESLLSRSSQIVIQRTKSKTNLKQENEQNRPSSQIKQKSFKNAILARPKSTRSPQIYRQRKYNQSFN